MNFRPEHETIVQTTQPYLFKDRNHYMQI